MVWDMAMVQIVVFLKKFDRPNRDSADWMWRKLNG